LLSPLVLILGLALAGGGFALSDRHIAGLVVWLLLAVLLVLGAAGRATLGRPFYWSFGLILALALLSASSSLWSGSIELSVIEADRDLVYLGLFLAAFLIAQTGQRRQRFGEGIAIALLCFAALALASRLLPHVFDIAEGPGSGPRLSYPLGYWNAVGLLSALAATLALWMSRNSLSSWLRWAAVALMPTALLALYFTYSRGGLLALLISCGCLIALSHDRLWLLGTLAIGAIGAVPAVLAAQASNSLAENLDDSQIVGEGLLVLGLLIVGSLLALALFAALRRLERRSGPLTGQAVTLSRNPRLLRGVALAAVLLGIGIAVAVGGRAWDQFNESDVKFPSNPAQHFGQLSGAGRGEFWRVSIDAFEEEPVLGHGAGTYRFSWHLLRDTPTPNIDAHSLYLQAFAELGIVGGLLVLAMVAVLLWTGFRAWQAARGPRRELYAALLGVCLAFAVGVAIDWYWQIAVVPAIFFLAAAVLVAARCAQLLRVRSAANGHAEQRRYGLTIAGLALAWIVALALVGPLLVDREIDSSNAAVAAGNLPDAVGHAETARSIEPWATSPYLQLALLAEREGNYPEAIQRIGEAIDREEESWLLYYIRARVEHKAGDAAAAQADFAEAERLNPEEQCLEYGFEGCG
jgi:O-antigen ligase